MDLSSASLQTCLWLLVSTMSQLQTHGLGMHFKVICACNLMTFSFTFQCFMTVMMLEASVLSLPSMQMILIQLNSWAVFSVFLKSSVTLFILVTFSPLSQFCFSVLSWWDDWFYTTPQGHFQVFSSVLVWGRKPRVLYCILHYCS